MKILINSISGKLKEEIREINTLKEFKDLVDEFGTTLINTDHVNDDAVESYKLFHKEKMKGCEIEISQHDDYIE